MSKILIVEDDKKLREELKIFFSLPLELAIIHSIFEIQFGIEVMSGIANKKRATAINNINNCSYGLNLWYIFYSYIFWSQKYY